MVTDKKCSYHFIPTSNHSLSSSLSGQGPNRERNSAPLPVLARHQRGHPGFCWRRNALPKQSSIFFPKRRENMNEARRNELWLCCTRHAVYHRMECFHALVPQVIYITTSARSPQQKSPQNIRK